MNEYAQAAGQSIWWNKSRIMVSPNTPINLKWKITQKLHVIQNRRNDKYLGIPFMLGQRKAYLFDYINIVIKVSKRINKWYNKFLSYADKGFLFKLLTIPRFAMPIS